MTSPEITRFGDGHFQRVIYGLGPYIADYEEQVVLAAIIRNWCPKCLSIRTELDKDKALLRCHAHTDLLVDELNLGTLWDEYRIIADVVPFTNDFPRADIHELLSPDILHQLIKGTFKDHLVDWVEKYLTKTHGKRGAETILSDIDQHISVVPAFTGLRRFPEGRGFKQWTGDDSKALMKVYLPAIEGYVPADVICTLRAFLEFCYLVRRNVITEESLHQIQDALDRFHRYRTIFQTTGVVFNFSLPRQHSMVHYPLTVQLFGAPNGLCSSITELKHIKAVKEPWRRSNQNDPLGQMLTTNQQLDKLTASRVDFEAHGMLKGLCLLDVLDALKSTAPDDGDSHRPATTLDSGSNDVQPQESEAETAWEFEEGEVIDGPTIPTCIELAKTVHGMGGLEIAWILCFFSFVFEGDAYLCAVAHWFEKVSDEADENTGMWVVKPSYHDSKAKERHINIIHIDSIYHAAHLIPVYGEQPIPHELKHYHSYDTFQSFYVNKFADHHAFEIAF
ncbi:hypothetical protein PAXRUDRAFT_11252 [Paxillus rubicundulus Ve08.2h10]|uniref:Uncharacterized protein n=1 Tax=Paxillus rubicundulus Ve08.2h10 TaxID=930991 RepID=A0A0D0E9F8_9AGAM|nr:hypothetical protein PAXRUDRAFT_11252 [Paxillus rubicundulus Ve08.2h10]